jgi:hypothetical protein
MSRRVKSPQWVSLKRFHKHLPAVQWGQLISISLSIYQIVRQLLR